VAPLGEVSRVDAVLLRETRAQRSGRRDAQSIAAVAERIARTRDETDPELGIVPGANVLRRTEPWIGARLLGREVVRKAVSHLGSRHQMISNELCAFGDRHDLEESRQEAPLPCPEQEPLDLVVVDAAKDDRVELYGMKASALGCRDPVEHGPELAAARDGAET